MTCGHCELSMQEELAVLDGVTEVHADHTSGQVTVTSASLDPAAVAAAVEEAGYSLS